MGVHVLLSVSGKLAGVACNLEELAVAAYQPDRMKLPDVLARQIVITGCMTAANDD